MHTTTKRTVVDIDTRRSVIVIARARKPKDVQQVPHEAFIRNMLKDRMGWPRREPAPESIKQAAKQMAAALVQRDKEAVQKAIKDAAEKAKLEAQQKAEAEAQVAA